MLPEEKLIKENQKLRQMLEHSYSIVEFLRGSLGSDQTVAFEVADEYLDDYVDKWETFEGEEE